MIGQTLGDAQDIITEALLTSPPSSPFLRRSQDLPSVRIPHHLHISTTHTKQQVFQDDGEKPTLCGIATPVKYSPFNQSRFQSLIYRPPRETAHGPAHAVHTYFLLTLPSCPPTAAKLNADLSVSATQSTNHVQLRTVARPTARRLAHGV